MKTAPCKDCQNRTRGCHSVCDRYKKYAEWRNEFNREKLIRSENERAERGFIKR